MKTARPVVFVPVTLLILVSIIGVLAGCDRAPIFTSNLPEDYSIRMGSPHAFSVVVKDSDRLKYKWEESSDSGASWNNTGTDSATCAFMKNVPGTWQIRVTVSDSTDKRIVSTICTVMVNSPVSTLAGSGTRGFADGTGTTASFWNPVGIAVDDSGNVYVADWGNNKIRKVTPEGVVTTLAGSGAEGSADGKGPVASFHFPSGVAVGGSGNIYVADLGNNTIRKITSSGDVTTFAGSGAEGHVDGTGTASSFNHPSGVAVDGSGNVYVADSWNNKVRKITPAGDVATLAGSGSRGSADGKGTEASFKGTGGVAVDGSGNVYVADMGNNTIRKVTPEGVVTTLAGSGAYGSDDGKGTAASFNLPIGVAVDGSGNIYVGDTNNNKIRKITSGGVVTTLAGSGEAGSSDGPGATATFNGPNGVAVDSSGNVYVADTDNRKIRKIVQ